MKAKDIQLKRKVRVLVGYCKGMKATILQVYPGDQYPVMVEISPHLGIMFYRYNQIEYWNKPKNV